jgi:hypothetical protein
MPIDICCGLACGLGAFVTKLGAGMVVVGVLLTYGDDWFRGICNIGWPGYAIWAG